MRSIQVNRGLNFTHSLGFWHIGKASLNTTTQCIEPLLHSANPIKQLCIYKCGDRLAVFVDNHTVMPVLHLIKHFTQVLSKVDRICFCNHHATPNRYDHTGHYGLGLKDVQGLR